MLDSKLGPGDQKLVLDRVVYESTTLYNTVDYGYMFQSDPHFQVIAQQQGFHPTQFE